MPVPIKGSINLDDTAQGAVKTSSNISSGQKFADTLKEGADAVGDIAGSLAQVLPSGGAVLSAISSGLSSVTGGSPGPFGGGGGGLGSLLGGSPYSGAMGGGGGLAGGIAGIAGAIGGGSGVQGAANAQNKGFSQQLSMLNLQRRMQEQSQMITMISAIINIQHQTAQAIIQNIH